MLTGMLNHQARIFSTKYLNYPTKAMSKYIFKTSSYLQDNTIVAFFSQRSGSVETFGSNDYISYEIECADIPDSGVDRTVSNLLGAT